MFVLVSVDDVSQSSEQTVFIPLHVNNCVLRLHLVAPFSVEDFFIYLLFLSGYLHLLFISRPKLSSLLFFLFNLIGFLVELADVIE